MVSCFSHKFNWGLCVNLSSLPLNALRAFDASARHLNFTRAAEDLYVTQGAVSHQVRALETLLGVTLFRRLARGLALTEAGEALWPAVARSFETIGDLLEQVREGAERRPLTVGVVNTYATGALLPRIADFESCHPFVELRLKTHNNKVNLAVEGLDLAIQFGDGAWPGLEAVELAPGALAPLCSPRLARGLRTPADLAGLTLLRSYRADEWPRWFALAGLTPPPPRGPVFDSSIAMAAAAEQSIGVALAPPQMFGYEIRGGRLVQPFDLALDAGGYYLTRLASRTPTAAMQAFAEWCLDRLRHEHSSAA
jgi:LysR family transcriptional regulator of beta-lactamase